MTKRCAICKQPITNTPYHHNWGNKDRCAKHCNCSSCQPPDDGSDSLLGLPSTILTTELVADVFSSPDPSPTVDPAPDPTPDFGGFDGGSSGGGGASGDF